MTDATRKKAHRISLTHSNSICLDSCTLGSCSQPPYLLGFVSSGILVYDSIDFSLFNIDNKDIYDAYKNTLFTPDVPLETTSFFYFTFNSSYDFTVKFGS